MWRTGLIKHLNGSAYLGGLVLDCLLKARLLEKHTQLDDAAPSELGRDDQRRWNLVYRPHDLEGMLAELPGLARDLQNVSGAHADRLDTLLKSACSRWTVHVRYLTSRVERFEAEQFLRQVEELKRWR